MLVKHVRDENRVPFATIVAIKKGDRVTIGTSFCCPKDHFKKKRGIEIALGRARAGSVQNAPTRCVNGDDMLVAVIMDEEFDMMDRARKYFKTA